MSPLPLPLLLLSLLLLLLRPSSAYYQTVFYYAGDSCTGSPLGAVGTYLTIGCVTTACTATANSSVSRLTQCPEAIEDHGYLLSVYSFSQAGCNSTPASFTAYSSACLRSGLTSTLATCSGDGYTVQTFLNGDCSGTSAGNQTGPLGCYSQGNAHYEVICRAGPSAGLVVGVIIAVLVVIGLAVGGYFLWKRSKRHTYTSM